MEIEQQKTKQDLQLTAKQSQQEQSVKVAVRVRPFIQKELIEKESSCVAVDQQNNQISIGNDKSFNFDVVYGINTEQKQVYDSCVQTLVKKCFEGYNATILAYGQTGAGKTYTMGTSNLLTMLEDESGIIPRSIKDIFCMINEKKDKSEFLIKVSYYEIYNDNIVDLLDSNTQIHQNKLTKEQQKKDNGVVIREEKDGSINIYGITEESVSSPEEMLAALERGGLNRTTSSTLMNSTSSRSHAIFTIFIEQHLIEDLYKNDQKAENLMNLEQTANTNNENNPLTSTNHNSNGQNPDGIKNIGSNNNNNNVEANDAAGYTQSKFHFVDLAGSERLKKTGNTGSAMREGININMGLLALGNVISALTSDKKSKHIPYRDSKLTRILQDSLGGNSNTLMIACVSPAESNFEESLNTLKYANRARKIQNKPIVNRDPQSAIIAQLKQQVFEMTNEILKYRRLLTFNNIDIKQQKDLIQQIPNEIQLFSSPGKKNYMSNNENDSETIKNLKLKLLSYEKEIPKLKAEIQNSKKILNDNEIQLLTMKNERDKYRQYFEKANSLLQLHNISCSLEDQDDLQVKSLIQEYSEIIEKQKTEIKDKDQLNKELQIEYESLLKENRDEKNLLIKKTKSILQLQQEIHNLQNNLDTNKNLHQSEDNKLTETTNLPKTNDIENNQSSTKNFDTKNMISTNINGNGVQMNLENNSSLQNDSLQATDITQNELLNQELEEEIDKIIECDEDFKQQKQQIDDIQFQVNTELNQVNGSILQKEKILQEITQKHLGMQNNLIGIMKEQYHQKIQELEKSMKILEQQRDDALQKISSGQGLTQSANLGQQEQQKQVVIGNYKAKVTDLEKQLRDLKFKEKEQQSLHKTVDQQDQKIKGLSDEIRKFKVQKLQLIRQLKDKLDIFDKFKKQKSKELTVEKKKIMQKDNQIRKLELEKRKQDRLLLKKNDDINSMQQQKEILQKLINTNIHQTKNFSKRILDDQELASLEMQQGQNQLVHYIKSQLKSIQENIDTKYQMNKVEFDLQQTENENQQEQQKLSQLILQREELEMRLQQVEEEDEIQINEIQQQIESIKQNEEEQQRFVESIQEKYKYLNQKLHDQDQILRANDIQKILKNLLFNENFKSIQNFQLLSKLVFDNYLQAIDEMQNNLQQISQQTQEIDMFKTQVEQLQNQIKISQINYQKEIEQLKLDYQNINDSSNIQNISQIKVDDNFVESENEQDKQDQDQFIKKRKKQKSAKKGHTRTNSIGSQSPNQNSQSQQLNCTPKRKNTLDDQTMIKQLQKKIQDYQKQIKQKDQIIDHQTRKCEVYKSKYDTLKKTNKKDVFIGIQKQTIDTTNFSVTSENDLSQSQNLTRSLQIKAQTLNSLRDVRRQQKESKQQILNQQNSTNNNLQQQQQKGILLEDTTGIQLKTEGNLSNQDQPPFIVNRNSFPGPELNISKQFSNSSFIEVSNQSVNSSFQKELQTVINNQNKWDCHEIKDAHSDKILCIASFGNIICSTSAKYLKLWDIENKQKISEILAHQGYVKGLAICNDKKFIATSADKTIKLWDIRDMSQIQTMNQLKDNINTLYIVNDIYLLSGGKGSATVSALYAWDLRQPNYPLYEESEKNQDIFTMVENQGMLYYGGRNHIVRRVDLENFSSKSPFEPPHYDGITSLCLLQGYLLSGSRDRKIGLWNLEQATSNLKYVQYCNEQISSMESNNKLNILYSGFRDGKIKVWKIGLDRQQDKQQEKLNCICDISKGNLQINSICNLQENYENMFATCGNDKAIRIWNPTQQTLQNIINYDPNQQQNIMDLEENNELQQQL